MFDAYFAYQARVRPRALALITPGGALTYAELNADVNRYAAALSALGVGPDTGVVRIETSRRVRYYIALLALARLGVATTATADDRADLKLSDLPGSGGPGVLALSPEWMTATQAAEPREVVSAVRDPEGLARVSLSSGSTGLPKRVPLSWRRMEVGGLNALGVYGAGKLGIWIIRTGIESSLGFSMATLAWSIGAAVAADFGTEELPFLIEAHGTGLLGLTPMQLRGLMRALPPGFSPQPGLRVVVSGGLLPPALAREARIRLTPDIHIIYGSSETGRAMVGPAARLETSGPGVVGWPVPGVTVEVVDPQGAPVPDGEQGELRIRGERNAGRYLDDAVASSHTFRDGFAYPGDLGRRLPDGLFVVDGRVDERMTLGSIKLLPEVLENAALEFAGVQDAAAFTVPNPGGLDQCWLAIVGPEDLDREALSKHVMRSRRGLPRLRFAWTETIPRNANGKIDRAALRAQTAQALGEP